MIVPALKSGKKELPLVPLRELVVFPHMVVPFFAGQNKTIHAIEECMKGDRMVVLVCQKNETEDPGKEDIYQAGTIAKVLQMLKLPDGTVRVLAEGRQRAALKKYDERKETRYVVVQPIEERKNDTEELTPLMTTVRNSFEKYTQYQKKVSEDVKKTILQAEYPDKLVDLICANTALSSEKKVELLGITDYKQRLETLAVHLEAENEVLSLQNKINSKVKKKMEQNQKEYYLNEQVRQINKELGKDDEDAGGTKELKEKIEAKNPPKEVKEKAEKEIKRLSRLQPMSPESGVLKTYLEWIAELPWSRKSRDNNDIATAERILDEDHYDMKKPKERVLDFLAVRRLQERVKGPILCFVGPPGTGKTSLGRSLARAMNREFIRVSLGGVRDEAEIRGHRKTYVGALPGKIIQSMRKAGTINPVFLLDEIDKLSSDFRGDPASALLEVLDPEQNSTFMDHYLELPYDLSHVMFITTANSIHSIPYALRDRMEVIEIPGYSDLEKERIAKQFIIPKQLAENGLQDASVTFHRNALLTIIRSYTMESGVRNLERQIAAVIRKIARKAVKQGYGPEAEETENTEETESTEETDNPEETESAEEKGSKYKRLREFSTAVTEKNLKKYLGPPQFEQDLVYRAERPGLAHGLAWTELGGKLLPVEASLLPGEGKLILTGSLGDVMKESAQLSLSFIRAYAETFGIDPDFQKKQDFHIHVPQGAIPKDGPSAGITITAAMLSALSGTPVPASLAMTGEITLTGRLLAIGGVKEKILAAYRNNLEKVLLPEDNRKDIEELPKEVSGRLGFAFASTVREALLTLFPDFNEMTKSGIYNKNEYTGEKEEKKDDEQAS
ncbi:MAG: endopeptidase La [Spirochaetia bacterium]